MSLLLSGQKSNYLNCIAANYRIGLCVRMNKTCKRSVKTLEKYRLADEVGLRFMNIYMDHLEKCESCRAHFGVGEFEPD